MADGSVDVVVVGQGVVGQLTSLLIAQRGHRVVAVEQHAAPYSLPRAVHYDPDVNRTLAGLGISAQEQAVFSEPSLEYQWLSADRELLLTFPTPVDGPQGWPESTMFNQPGLESAIRRRQAELPNLDIRFGRTLTALSSDEHGVEATVRTGAGIEGIRARYVVGCDGAGSTVRALAGLVFEDLDFSSDWLVVDLLLHDPRRMDGVPDFQSCDPERPTSSVSGGPGRRRFEFMLLEGEAPQELATEAQAWELIAPWGLTPADATIERLAPYRFNARCATQWRAGRVFIAGDAAHQMPPFFGRGVVSGIRDAVNLGWKLDLVLRGLASDALLDTYGTERHAHVQFALNMSVELGRIICETEPSRVAARDRRLLENGPLPWNVLPPMPPERLGPGLFPGGEPGDDPVAGVVGVQGRVGTREHGVVLLDELTFGTTVLLVDGRIADAASAQALRGHAPAGWPLSIVLVLPRDAVAPVAPDGVLVATDLDDRYLPLLDAARAHVVVYRPDLHGFGSALLEDAPGLLAALAAPPALALIPR